ncbi:MAG: SDR family NAD(P)-dependent oxidoreductase, partial [Rhizobiales bacterium]|nr:SDR family NAD(P)-dependent oxidoreductase [Hyphomicrobiales bacterium]
MKTIFIIGMGPGVSSAVSERFAREGFAVGLVARRVDKLREYQAALSQAGARSAIAAADAAQPGSLTAAMQDLEAELGAPGVLVYNAISHTPGGALALPAEDFERE